MSIKQSPLLQTPSLADMKRIVGADQVLTIGRNSTNGKTFMHLSAPMNPLDLIAVLLQTGLSAVAQLAQQQSLIINPNKPNLEVVPPANGKSEESPDTGYTDKDF